MVTVARGSEINGVSINVNSEGKIRAVSSWGRKRIGKGDLDRVENGHGGVELNYSLMVDVE